MSYFSAISRVAHPDFCFSQKKPVGPYEIDYSNHLARSSLRFLFMADSLRFLELVGGRTMEPVTLSNTSIEYNQFGPVIRSVAGGTILFPETIDLGATEDYTITFLVAKDDPNEVGEGMVAGLSTNNDDYIWMRETNSGRDIVFNRSGTGFTITAPVNSAQYEMRTFVFSNSGTDVDYYQGTYHSQSTTTSARGFTMDSLLDGFGGTGFDFVGVMGFFAVFMQSLTPGQVRSLHANPYQLLKCGLMRQDIYVPSAVVAGAGFLPKKRTFSQILVR